MDDDYFYYDINNNQVASCSTFSTINTYCEICNILITFKNEDNIESPYVDHLISIHSVEEIEKKVKDTKILNLLGIESTISKDPTTKNYKMYQCNLCKNLIGVVSSFDVIKLDENLIESNNRKINHLEKFHKISFQNKNTKSNINLLSDFTGIEVNFKSSTDFYKCSDCEMYMENSPEVINYHNSIHKLDLNLLKEIENKKFYCYLCDKSFDIEEAHHHYSFLGDSGKTNELHLQYFQIKENFDSFPNDIGNSFNSHVNHNYNNNIFNNNITHNFSKNVWPLPVPNKKSNKFDNKLNTEFTNHSTQNKPKVKDYSKNKYPSNYQHIDFSDGDEDYLESLDHSSEISKCFKKRKVDESVDLKIKELELFSSVSRVITNQNIDSEFSNKFSNKVFDYIDFMSNMGHLHYYYKEKKESTALLLKRLNTEFTKLSENLPCNFSSSYFIRADSNYPQFIKVLIAGSRGTPYEHGLYEFDIYLPCDYPMTVPKCQLKTTGNGLIRFNPNLYNCGKVCLSLLGTWSGSSVEKWDPKLSSLTQLLISLSSLVMNDRIIENEPSYGNSLSTVRGVEENEGYANVVRIGNISHAMLDQIKLENKIFGDVIKEYFGFKSKEMILDIETWFDRFKNSTSKYTGLTNLQNFRMCKMLNDSGYENILNKKIEELKILLKI